MAARISKRCTEKICRRIGARRENLDNSGINFISSDSLGNPTGWKVISHPSRWKWVTWKEERLSKARSRPSLMQVKSDRKQVRFEARLCPRKEESLSKARLVLHVRQMKNGRSNSVDRFFPTKSSRSFVRMTERLEPRLSQVQRRRAVQRAVSCKSIKHADATRKAFREEKRPRSDRVDQHIRELGVVSFRADRSRGGIRVLQGYESPYPSPTLG